MRKTSNNSFRNSSSLLSFALSSFIGIEIQQMSSKNKKEKHTYKQKVFLQFYNDMIVHGIFLKNDKDIFVKREQKLEYKEHKRVHNKKNSKCNSEIMKHFFRTSFRNGSHSSWHAWKIERNIFILYENYCDKQHRNNNLSDVQDFYHALFFKK